jgi:oligopeptide/dipeptide ABC transporter ATP-binding protein
MSNPALNETFATTSEPAPMLEVTNLTKHFTLHGDLVSRSVGRTRVLKAVDDISFVLRPSETLGLVGESGCGKSTTGRLITRLIEPTSGRIELDGQDLLTLSGNQLLKMRKKAQLVFQDPYSSLNPRKTIMQILERPLVVHKLATGWSERRERVLDLLNMVGLGREHIDRYPHEFSGGQRQRIAIARALAVEPRIVIGDEPVSALDVSIQAQVLNLFRELQEKFSLTYLFIAHDLSVIRHISDTVVVMYVGKVVESGPVEAIFSEPQHPYTKALMAAVPVADPKSPPPRLTLTGEVSSPIDPPPGCRLYKRCPIATPNCTTEPPPLRDFGGGHMVACHNA